MPYVGQTSRIGFKESPGALREDIARCCTAGDLNYLFTQIALAYLHAQRVVRYQHISDVIGALEGAKLEFYRRLASPYEDHKIVENGDVFVGAGDVLAGSEG